MTEQEALAIYHQGPEATVAALMTMDAQIDQLQQKLAHLELSPKDVTTPSAMKPVYAKAARKRRRRKRPGRPNGHPGSRRVVPQRIDSVKEHKLVRCSRCHNALGESFEVRVRYTEEIPPVEMHVTEHRIHRYHCGYCHKIVEPVVTQALPKSTIGLRTLVFSAWLHYGLGVTLSKGVRLLNTIAHFKVTAGGLVQAWHRLATWLQPAYEALAEEARQSATFLPGGRQGMLTRPAGGSMALPIGSGALPTLRWSTMLSIDAAARRW